MKNDYKNKEKYIAPCPFTYDKDGVMLWHGIRCEKSPPTEELINTYNELMEEVKKLNEKQDKRTISTDVSR